MDNMSFSELVTFIGCFGVCGLVFAAIGIWALCRKTPMHFWAGDTIPAEKISNVKKYNLANGIMWIMASLPYFASAIIACFDFNFSLIFVWIGVGCTLLLIPAYLLIYKHFSVEKK